VLSISAEGHRFRGGGGGIVGTIGNSLLQTIGDTEDEGIVEDTGTTRDTERGQIQALARIRTETQYYITS
jgi:hypothetical protein